MLALGVDGAAFRLRVPTAGYISCDGRLELSSSARRPDEPTLIQHRKLAKREQIRTHGSLFHLRVVIIVADRHKVAAWVEGCLRIT